MTTSGTLRRRDVLVRNGRITAIDRAQRDRAGGITTIDGAGHTLLPGLVDSHPHLTIPSGRGPADRPRSAIESVAARQLLRSGVTSGLEAGRSLGVPHREAFGAATEHGARVLRPTGGGRLAVGSRADFILYRGAVDDGPFDMSRVLVVAKDGIRFVVDGKWIGVSARETGK